MESYDLVVIGSGPAGEKGAALAAYFGKRVAIVDRTDRPGGAPVNRGGIPTKTLREAALYLTGFRRRELYGVGLGLTPEFALERLRSRAAQVSAAMGEVVRSNLDRHGIDLIHGQASLGPGRTVTVACPDGSERTLAGDVILIATGSRPFRPPGIPFDDPDVYDSDTILELDQIPGSLLVIGGGPVGSEYASIFTALGVAVTIVDGADRLLPLLDVEMSGLLHQAFTGMGMQVLLEAPGARVERSDGRLRVTLADGRVLEPEKVLFAAGRVGNTEELGLDRVGLELDERGRFVVDEHFRTSDHRIYAAGDVIGPPALASVSAEQGRIAACHAFKVPFDLTLDWLPPVGIYSLPEVGMVGMTEQAAAEAQIPYEVGRARFEGNARSRIVGTTEGMIKLVLRSDDRRLLGVHIVGEDAAELVHTGQAVMHAGGTIDALLHTTYNIPTRGEAYKYAAYDALGRLNAATAATDRRISAR